MSVVKGALDLEQLEAAVADGTIDTVIVTFVDMHGRLVGKRMDAEYFLEEEVAERGTDCCSSIVTLDMESDATPGFQVANVETGYRDFVLQPDLGTLRAIPWHEATALVLCDAHWHDGSPVNPSPRTVLRRQVERARSLGFEPMVGSELEFYLCRETYAEARARDYRDLTLSTPYVIDYHLLATGFDEPFVGRLRRAMRGAGVPVEYSKGEAWAGQHEIALRHADPVTVADNHVVYKHGAKEIAYEHGCSVTFMAKPNRHWFGNSCHVHMSLWQGNANAFAGESEIFRRFLAGQLACIKELAVFVAPAVNSYKRFVPGIWAGTTLAWAHDNRTSGFRIVGRDSSLRVEARIPGGDCNPYLTFAALLAAGLYGIENKLEPPPPYEGNAYDSDAERFHSTLREAIAALERGSMARAAFGDDVVDHYLHAARSEQQHFDRVVTDYERERLFERG
jgi:glutamine synthetase